MEHYFEFKIICNDDIRDMLIAELAEENYEGFIELENGFSAYVSNTFFKREVFEQVLEKYGLDPNTIPQSNVAQQNWNAQWEAAYEPIIVADKILIRAPFHQVEEGFDFVLTIQPKNTFGTGHHETTQLMLQLMLEENFYNKQVFDYGCGTGVLGLMAIKMGAKKVLGIDIDDWCVDNIEENKKLNDITTFEFMQGNLQVLNDTNQYDCILANINKNILLLSFESLSKHLTENGALYISGFYENDLYDLEQAALSYNLNLHHHITKNDWCAAVFKKHIIDL